MNAKCVRQVLSIPLLLSTGFAVAPLMQAQTNTDGPRVLVIQREVTKPGRDGTPHEATEAGFIRAVQANKAGIHYIALTSLSGVNRALFISAYPSLAAVDEERRAMPAAAQVAMDKAMLSDGDLLSDTSASVWLRRDELSTNVGGPPVGMRLLEVTEFVVKPGHEHEFEELGKMYVSAAKDIPQLHWTCFQLAYGNSVGTTYIVLTALKSGEEADAEFAAGKKFEEAVGEDGMKKMSELAAASISTEMTNLFAVNPKMSIPPDSMVKAEPDFWKPKAGPTAAKKTTAAPKPGATGQ